MKEPEYGLCLPAEIISEPHDGDTVKVKVSWIVTVRLEDLRLEELHDKNLDSKAIAQAAKQEISKVLPIGTKVKLWVKPSLGKLSSIFTFGRVVGRLFKDGIDITEYMNEWRSEYDSPGDNDGKK